MVYAVRHWPKRRYAAHDYKVQTGLGRCVDHPPPSSDEVKERIKLHLCIHSGPSWTVLRWTTPFIAHIQVFAWYHYSNLLDADSLSVAATLDCFKELKKFWPINFENEGSSFRKDAACKWVLMSTANLEQGTFWRRRMSVPRKLSSCMYVAIECPWTFWVLGSFLSASALSPFWHVREVKLYRKCVY